MPATTQLPPRGIDVANAYALAPPGIKASVAACPDADAGGCSVEEVDSLNLIFRTAAGSLEDRAVVVNDIRDSVSPPEGISATPSGLAVVGFGLLENLEANRTLLTYVALALVLVFLLLRLRGLMRALLCMVPVHMGVGATSLIAYAAGFTLSPRSDTRGVGKACVCK